MKYLLTSTLFLLQTVLFSQGENSTSPLTFSGYLETYYLYDFDNPADHKRPDFVYAFNRHNEVNLNLGFLKAAYAKENVRANMALMAGTYANANLAAEPGVLRNILEANVGLKISKSKNLWIDAGVFGSHIGFESAVGKDCWGLTRSMMADNSPYFETGVKIGYTSEDEKWFFSGLLLNGWQRIQRVDGNNTPAFGHQLTFKPNDKVTLNSSSLICNDKPDTVRQMRYFHDFYGIFQVFPKVALTAGFDIGAEQKAKGSNDYNIWYTPILMAKISASDKLCFCARLEYFQDENGVMISTGTRNGFQTWGYSLNLDYVVLENMLWRLEARTLGSKDYIFTRDGDPSRSNLMLATSFAVSF
ncbi:MAG: porin [Saprospiraceae bacterium]